MSVETSVKVSCNICGICDYADMYRFPKGFKYYYFNGQTNHACPSCISKGKEVSLIRNDKHNSSKVIIDPVFFLD